MVPASPIEVAEYFQWCWGNRDPNAYQQLFTGDYEFVFATGDSAGNFYATTPWTRTDELACADHLFRDGTPTEPPATSITLDYVQALDVQPDPRPRMNSKWHELVTAQVLLRVNLADGTKEIRGPTYFYVVRGDSAQMTADMTAAGFKPDSTRWWIQQWADGTLQSAPGTGARHSIGPARTLPSHGYTWGELKTQYR
ncbi:MAG TPA: hypothetical protein VL123_00470 [Candidatus Udaeobacter sp.]|nr:hypothetical protein [Candidatus Udaeobacter sp.]